MRAGGRAPNGRIVAPSSAVTSPEQGLRSTLRRGSGVGPLQVLSQKVGDAGQVVSVGPQRVSKRGETRSISRTCRIPQTLEAQ